MTLPIAYLLAPVLLANLAAFAAVGIDKRRAAKDRWRIPERTLLLLGLPLGAPGLLLGMKLFRHKTAKLSFKVRAGVLVLANLGIAGLLLWLDRQGLLSWSLT